jgi:hypothetical protein
MLDHRIDFILYRSMLPDEGFTVLEADLIGESPEDKTAPSETAPFGSGLPIMPEL